MHLKNMSKFLSVKAAMNLHPETDLKIQLLLPGIL